MCLLLQEDPSGVARDTDDIGCLATSNQWPHIHQGASQAQAFGKCHQDSSTNHHTHVHKFITKWLFKIHIAFSAVVVLLFLHDRPWISPWIKSISNELHITCHVYTSQLSGHCDVIANRLWRHQQNVKRASETRGWCVKILVFSVIYGFVMSCKK